MDGKQLQSRIRVILLILAAIFLAFGGVLYSLQVTNYDYYHGVSTRKIADEETVEAGRGSLLDRYGRVLVSNGTGYQVTLDTSVMGGTQGRNAMVERLLELCREEGVAWTDTLPISKTEPFVYTMEDAGATARSRFLTLLDTMGDSWADGGAARAIADELSRRSAAVAEAQAAAAEAGAQADEAEATGEAPAQAQPVEIPTFPAMEPVSADALFQSMRTWFELDPDIPDDEARAIVGVLYELALRSKGAATSEYVFASDVDITFISKLKEGGYKGVETKAVSVREYNTPYAAHLLGRVGPIYAEEWADYKALGYGMNDIVGKEGVELAFEQYLRGESGTRTVERNTDGKVVSETWKKYPAPGDNVILTVDLRLQEVLERSLAQHVPGLTDQVRGASGVIIDVKDGGVLSMASYPTFDLSTYTESFNTLQDDPLEPLYNRATQGLYSPGSTFKMVMGVAGLQEEAITTTEKILDTGFFQYPKGQKYPYGDYHPKCWYYRQYGRTHSYENLSEALKDSCNVYFYTVGDRLGISQIDHYARMFGLGQRTGIELYDEAGMVAGPETSEALGQRWEGGNLLSASIGQGNTLVTPVQLANYVATLVNGGDRYPVHLLKSVKSSDYSSVVAEYDAQPLDSIAISEENLEAVKYGMRLVALEGAGVHQYFDDLDVSVGCKTGTAQVATTSEANAVFVAFAPYEDPQIAIALVAEKGGSGGGLAAIAADVFSYYFSAQENLEAVSTENALIR